MNLQKSKLAFRYVTRCATEFTKATSESGFPYVCHVRLACCRSAAPRASPNGSRLIPADIFQREEVRSKL